MSVCTPAAARTELELIQGENLQIASLQTEVERSKEAPRPRRQPPPLRPKTHTNAPLSSVQFTVVVKSIYTTENIPSVAFFLFYKLGVIGLQ